MAWDARKSKSTYLATPVLPREVESHHILHNVLRKLTEQNDEVPGKGFECLRHAEQRAASRGPITAWRIRWTDLLLACSATPRQRACGCRLRCAVVVLGGAQVGDGGRRHIAITGNVLLVCTMPGLPCHLVVVQESLSTEGGLRPLLLLN